MKGGGGVCARVCVRARAPVCVWMSARQYCTRKPVFVVSEQAQHKPRWWGAVNFGCRKASGKHVRVIHTLLNSKIGVYRGIHYFLLLFFYSKTLIVGTRLNRLSEAVLTCTHNLCFEQKNENYHNFSSENYHFYGCEKSQYIARACFRNGERLFYAWIETKDSFSQRRRPKYAIVRASLILHRFGIFSCSRPQRNVHRPGFEPGTAPLRHLDK